MPDVFARTVRSPCGHSFCHGYVCRDRGFAHRANATDKTKARRAARKKLKAQDRREVVSV